MSFLTYIASDAPLREVKNPHYRTLSVNEALKIGMEIPEYMLEPEVDRDKPDALLWSDVTIVIDLENRTSYDGKADDNYAIWPLEKTADILTEKRFCVYLEWQYTQGRANQVIKYIKENLEHTDEVEIWRIWMGGGFPQRIIKAEIPVDKLTVDDVRKIDTIDPWLEKRNAPTGKRKSQGIKHTDELYDLWEPTAHYCFTIL